MHTIPAHLQPSTDPAALPEAQIMLPGIRVTMLFDRLVRLEISPNGVFEDRASQVFNYRRQPLPEFDLIESEDAYKITTSYFEIMAAKSGRDVQLRDLSLRFRGRDQTWSLGELDPGNLLGTARTLDDIDGPVPLGKGLVSRSGWSLVEDTDSLLFIEDGWLEPRHAPPGYRDLYLFAYGNDYQSCLRDFYRLSGRTPLLPRWALGNWWSRYWAYTAEELHALMDAFKEHETPLAVCVVDMDWHLVDIGPGISGWTGYTWNRNLFPDPEDFIAELHEQGLRVCLNLHPALGVRPHEEQYTAFASRLGIDPDSQEDIPFDIANRDFAAAYLELLHHPEERRGIDFWWIDWQQGMQSTIPGLDPLWLLNHLHYKDLARDGKNRALILSRWGGLGSHRYPIGFSGDAHVTWDSLGFQPYFTATAANVGYGWWSHDIGGHMMGMEDPELYARWVQYGVFSPIFRIHSTNNPFQERRPWMYDAEIYRIAADSFRMRHALIPYLYTMAWRQWKHGQPLIQPMYHYYPEDEEAYLCPQQYMFGEELMAAPFVTPMDPDTRLSRRIVWFPPGGWYNFYSGEFFEGDRWQVVYGKLDEIPVFARAGAIVPLAPQLGWGGVESPDQLEVHLFVGSDGHFTLYEDDGSTLAYQRDECCLTEFHLQSSAGELNFRIEPQEPAVDIGIEKRVYTIHVFGFGELGRLDLTVNNLPVTCQWSYDKVKERTTIVLPALDTTVRANLRLAMEISEFDYPRSRVQEKCIELIGSFRLEPETKRAITLSLEKILDHPPLLLPFTVNMTDSQVLALLETIVEAGLELQDLYDHGKMLILWNNRENAEVVFSLSSEDRRQWDSASRFGSTIMKVPKKTAIDPPLRWKARLDFFGLFGRQLGSD